MDYQDVYQTIVIEKYEPVESMVDDDESERKEPTLQRVTCKYKKPTDSSYDTDYSEDLAPFVWYLVNEETGELISDDVIYTTTSYITESTTKKAYEHSDMNGD